MNTGFRFVFLLLCVAATSVAAQEKIKIPEVDRIRLAEAFRIGKSLGNRVWKGWDQAPFAVLLITPTTSF